MAKKNTELAKRGSTALANWEEELAKAGEEYAAQEANVGGGAFFSIKGGTLAFNGNPIPGNQMAVVILDSILANVFYPGEYDPDSPQTPVCYAFGRDEKTLAPHDESEEKQNDACDGCPKNQFGTADRGKGKACANRRRLALIPAGEINDDGDFAAYEDESEFSKGDIAYLMLSPTMLKGYASYVKQVWGTLKRPPFGVFTLIKVVPDKKNQVAVTFETLSAAPDELIGTLIDRNKEAKAAIEFPFPKAEARQEAPPPKQARGGGVRTQARPSGNVQTRSARKF